MTVTSEIEVPFDCSAFHENTQRNGTLYIPAGTKDLYIRFDGWRQFLNIVEMENNNTLVNQVMLNATSKEILQGQSFQLTATVLPTNAANKNVTWSSNNTSVATVNSSGLVTGVAPGSAVITCAAQDGSGVKATCNITVKAQQSENNIQFADAEVKRICVENWDSNGDGELSQSEAAAVTSLGAVFRNNTTITTFNELDYFTGLTFLNRDFNGCTSLRAICIPKNINSFYEGLNPLSNSPALRTVIVNSGNTTFDSRGNCNGIVETATNKLVCGTTGMTIPSTVTAIGPIAFANQEEMTSITIPSSVKSIGQQAFWGCIELQSVNIPASVTSIDKEVFVYCYSLGAITVDVNNPVYDSRENSNAIIEKATNTLMEGCYSTVVPSSVKHIAECAFGGRQWYWQNIDIPEGVETIGDNAYFLCHTAKELRIPSTMQSIGDYAFEDCQELTDVYSYVSNPFAISDNVFMNHYDEYGTVVPDYFSTATLHVPYGSKAAYEQADGWKNFQNIVEMDGGEIDPYNHLSMPDITAFCGRQTVLPVELENSSSLSGVQFDIQLPAGVTIATDEDGYLLLDNTSRDLRHTIDGTDLGGGKYRVLIYSSSAKAITGNSGAIVNITLDVSESAPEGNHTIRVSGISLSSISAEKTHGADIASTITIIISLPGDADGDGTIDVNDITCVAAYILGRNPANFNAAAADADGDGTIDVNDITVIAGMILNSGK